MKVRKTHMIGRANLPDIKSLIEDSKTERIVPIHIAFPKNYQKHSDKVLSIEDGEKRVFLKA